MPKRVCVAPGCPSLVDAGRTRCPRHASEYEAARGSTTERGYGKGHRAKRAELEPAAVGKLCHFCGLPMRAGQALALDHTEDRAGYRGMVHLSCNAADGGRRSQT